MQPNPSRRTILKSIPWFPYSASTRCESYELSQVIKSIVQRGRKVRVPSQDEVNISSSHPAKEKEKLKKCNQRKTNIYLLIKETACKSLSLLQITFKAHPDHDLMRGPVKMIRYVLTLLMRVV